MGCHVLQGIVLTQDWKHVSYISCIGRWVLYPSHCLGSPDSMDFSLPGSSVHGLSQARILEWVAIPFSRGSSQPRGGTRVFCIEGRFFTIWVKETQISCMNTYKWNLERWYVWTSSQGSSGVADRPQTCGHRRERKGWGKLKSIYYHVWNSQPVGLPEGRRELSLVLCDDREERDAVGARREVQEGGDTGTSVAASCWCMAEANTTLQSDYSPIKNK